MLPTPKTPRGPAFALSTNSFTLDMLCPISPLGSGKVHASMQLRANSVSCRRGERTLFGDVGFALGGGDCLIVRGPNGSGKTTLLRTLAGISRPSTGNIFVDRDEVVFIGHSNAIKDQLTARENLEFWASVFGTADAGAALKSFNLWEARNIRAKCLSAGQKQRLSLSRIGISRRKIWILDEPTASLDADGSAAILSRIRSHCRNGGIAVVATHHEFEMPGSKELDLSRFQPSLRSGLCSAPESPPS